MGKEAEYKMRQAAGKQYITRKNYLDYNGNRFFLKQLQTKDNEPIL